MTKLLRHLLLLCSAAALLASGCSAIAVDRPSAVRVPGVVFPALCAAFIEQEAFDPSTTTVVLNETRAVYETFALRVLHEAGDLTPAESELDLAHDETLKAHFVPTRIEIPDSAGSCKWRLADRPAQDYLGAKALVLELSNIVEDPFAPGGTPSQGLFARLSIGCSAGASWYWIALKNVDSSWRVLRVVHLDISDG